MPYNEQKKTPADFEKSLYSISQRARMNSDAVVRYAVLFASAREDDFAAFIESDGKQTTADAPRSRRWLRLDMNVFIFLMFVLGMVLSIFVMMARN